MLEPSFVGGFIFYIMKKIICGIYKITSPTGKIYIGESKNIYYRWSKYKKLHCKDQQGIFNSLSKHGVDNHIFEIIEECEEENLFCRERFWQDFYNTTSVMGLNGKLTECGEIKQEMSKTTKDKISNSLKEFYANGGEVTSNLNEEHRKKALLWHLSDSNTLKKLVLNLETGIFYNSIKEACNTTNYRYHYFKSMLNSKSKDRNLTNFITC